MIVKDEFSKGSIPLGKVTQIQRHEHKKKFIFEVHTSIEGRVFYILAETEAIMKEWMDAITVVWTLHTMKYACALVSRPDKATFQTQKGVWLM